MDAAAYISPSMLRGMALTLVGSVKTGLADDCHAMGSFLGGVASNIISAKGGFGTDELVSAMNLFIPTSVAVGFAGLASGGGVIQGSDRDNLIQFGNQGSSGYASPFQDSGNSNQDQGHHFAFYFMLGY